MDNIINCKNNRLFGVEIEVNTADGRIKKLNKNEIPLGSDRIALLINKAIKKRVEIQGWDYNFHNNYWIVKPDSSCGIEICTPVMRGWKDLKDLIRVSENLSFNNIKADHRCSLHVHVNVGDLDKNQIASIISWYIKCEHVIMDAFPLIRKKNRYCQMIADNDSLSVNSPLNPFFLLEKISNVKYYTLNAYHFLKGGGFDLFNSRKKTLEFRLGENEMCLDGLSIKNWVRFLLHFVDCTKDLGLPKKYTKNDKLSGLCLLDPDDVFKILKFDKPCSKGFEQMKIWFFERILKFSSQNSKQGVWSELARKKSRKESLNFFNNLKIKNSQKQDRNILLYHENYIE